MLGSLWYSASQSDDDKDCDVKIMWLREQKWLYWYDYQKALCCWLPTICHIKVVISYLFIVPWSDYRGVLIQKAKNWQHVLAKNCLLSGVSWFYFLMNTFDFWSPNHRLMYQILAPKFKYIHDLSEKEYGTTKQKKHYPALTLDRRSGNIILWSLE